MSHARPGGAGEIEPRSTPVPRRRHTTFARIVGAIGLVLLTSLLFWLLTDDAFRVSDASVRFRGLAHADEAAVREQLSDIERGPNVFRVRASEIVSELSTLTEVDAASARVTLPSDITVELDERDPVFIWSNGALSWLVDEEGMLFAPADEETAAAVAAARTTGLEPAAALDGLADEDSTDEEATDQEATDELDDPDRSVDGAPPDEADEADETTGSATGLPPAMVAARAALPVVRDERLWSDDPTVGDYLAAADHEVMRHLLAVTPELLGSREQNLQLRVDSASGYVLEGKDRGWSAHFGHYNLTLQPPSVIPRQVQCLRWLLASEERKLGEVRLALSDETCGTFTKFE